MRTVMARAAMLSSVGIALGVAAALVAATQMESLIYGMNTRDVGTFAIGAGVLLAISLAAAAIPARRAAQVDPATTLRVE